MSKFFKFLKYVILSVYVICGVALLVFAVPRTGWKALTVVTGSMRPTIPPGSLVVVHRVPNSNLKVGDVITFINPRNAKQTITHRIVETKTVSGLPAFVTKGDANQTADGEIMGGNVVGRVIWHAPHIGRVVNWTKSPLGLILLLGLPALLIIIDEIGILIRAFVPASAAGPADDPVPTSTAPVRPAPAHVPATTADVQAKPRRSMDGIMRVLLLGLLGSLVVRSTQAQLQTNPATLTRNTIATFVPASHLLINRVGLGSTICPTVASTVTISGIGPFSQNQISVITNCVTSSTTTNNVTVTNTNQQTSTTGSVASSGNTNGGSATSGNASNSNSTSTTVTINNGAGGLEQWVELYNPTATSVNLLGWSLRDNSVIPRVIGVNMVVPAHGFALISGGIGDGLTGAGDHLVLKDMAQTNVDSVSWGSDTSQLNPAVSAIAAGSGIHRRALGLDTDSATDWASGL